jgi:lysozyme
MKQRLLIGALSLSLMGGVGYQFIEKKEGTTLKSYQDQGGVWTICTGHIKSARPNQTVTRETCERLLVQDVTEHERQLKRQLPADTQLTFEQYLSLVSWVFNLGEGNFAGSTLRKKVIAGDCLGAGAEFPRWNRVNGVPVRGLTLRRNDERKLWESGC